MGSLEKLRMVFTGLGIWLLATLWLFMTGFTMDTETVVSVLVIVLTAALKQVADTAYIKGELKLLKENVSLLLRKSLE
jgi:hypothetical protein